MVAFARYLFDLGARTVELHPDGEHGKKFDIRGCLEGLGFQLGAAKGKTTYGGTYVRDAQRIIVSLTPGLGDVVGVIGTQTVVAECKGGILNSRHAGQLSKLRRGLCEAVGLLIARPAAGERHIAVVPHTVATMKLARRLVPRANSAGIEIALVTEKGEIVFVSGPE